MSTGTELLSGLDLEALVASRLQSMGVSHVWHNERGETNRWPDFTVLGQNLDAKGSTDWRGSMYLGAGQWKNDEHRHYKRGGVWYVLNDLRVIGFEQAMDCAEQKWVNRSPGLRICPENAPSLEDWVAGRMNNEGSDRRRSQLVLEAAEQPPQLVASLDAMRLAATC